MTVRSYAQNFEDVLLWRALKDVTVGHYVDVGAGHPARNSVTKLFYDRGWTGVNVEPLPHLATELSRARPRDTNVRAAVSDTSATSIDLISIDLWDELSTIAPDRAQSLRDQGRDVTVIPVPVARLDDVLADTGWADLHFLKVDVEGAELDVLRTLDLARTRPWIVLVEVVAGGDENRSRTEISDHLLSNRYEHVWFDGLNDFYVAGERSGDLAHHFTTPVNVTDDFTAVADSDQVVVELIAQRLGMDTPASASEVVMRVEAVLRDRIRFESELLAAQPPGSGDDTDPAVIGLRQEVRSLQLTCEALEQSSFERERLVAWYASQVARLTDDATRSSGDVEALRQSAADTRQRLDDVLASTSWRTTLPIRAARRPQDYLSKLLGK